MFDLSGMPTTACICGCKVFTVNVMWDDVERTVSWYDLKQVCKACGTVSQAPTPIDDEE